MRGWKYGPFGWTRRLAPWSNWLTSCDIQVGGKSRWGLISEC